MADETRRKTTRDPDALCLSGPQEAAIASLLVGSNVTEAAEAAGVARATVSGWLNHDPGFAAELANRRAELWEANRDQLRSVVDAAVKALRVLLADDDARVRLSAARAVLAAVPASWPELNRTTPASVEAGWRRAEQIRHFNAIL